MNNLTTATQSATTQFLTTARPIIKAMLAVENAIAPVTTARLADPKGYASYGKRSPESDAWAEAQSIVGRAATDLFHMLDGIRDNALCDHRKSCLIDMSEAEQDAVDGWNDQLHAGVISVNTAVMMIGDEGND